MEFNRTLPSVRMSISMPLARRMCNLREYDSHF
jgi:hypothetical protein